MTTTLHRGLTVVTASAAALAIWVIAVPGLGLDLAVRQGAARTVVNPASVLAASLVAGLIAWGLVAGLERLTPRARIAWRTSAVVALVLSLSGPLFGGVSAAATAVLVLMHLVVGGILLAWLAPR